MTQIENYNLTKDIKLFCVKATSFPAGIEAAFKTLEKKIGSTEGRIFFGISHGSRDGIIYKAAVQEAFEGEGEKLGFETFIVKKGEYATETIMDWRKNMQLIGPAFTSLLAHPQLDTNFPCIEWYKGDREVMCMIKIDPKK